MLLPFGLNACKAEKLNMAKNSVLKNTNPLTALIRARIKTLFLAVWLMAAGFYKVN